MIHPKEEILGEEKDMENLSLQLGRAGGSRRGVHVLARVLETFPHSRCGRQLGANEESFFARNIVERRSSGGESETMALPLG